ncbi:hypothetical protein NC653_009553 [Populus alba x Populus x berolinensis]|uniref:ABC1 atypical kinase-like domain-containing protein n=1 Tax=Populus alba x Populus x berolinensis TaxID=444605 RepID=A0AAD6RAH0_9ROSI|nr:hypothetical protein NC653_009553 [Populus alba x Populus x berolinensis]
MRMLGQPWQNIYSEPSPSPVAAGSLLGRVKANGDLVAVKAWRSFVLETVTVDLSIIRNWVDGQRPTRSLHPEKFLLQSGSKEKSSHKALKVMLDRLLMVGVICYRKQVPSH